LEPKLQLFRLDLTIGLPAVGVWFDDLVVVVTLVAVDREGAVVAWFFWWPYVVFDWTDNLLRAASFAL
jgi:hypothetical protein